MADIIDFDGALELTGWDLSRVDDLRDTLALEWAQRLPILPGAIDQVSSALRGTLSSLRGSAALKTASQVSNVVLAYAKALGAVRDALALDAARSSEAARRRLGEARDLAIANSYKLGGWWTNVMVEGDPNPTLKKKFKASVADFVGQATPLGVLYSHPMGTGRRDILRPSLMLDYGRPETRQLCFGGDNTIIGRCTPTLKAPAGADLGTCHSYTSDCDYSADGFFGKIAEKFCVPTALEGGCSVPYRSRWIYCLGAAPAWGWRGQPFPMSPAAVAIAVGLHSPSALHLAVEQRSVEQSLGTIIMRFAIDELAEDPGQTQEGVFRKGSRIVLRGKGRDATFTSMSGKHPFDGRWATLAAIVDAHHNWLALRRALLMTMKGLPGGLVSAAALSRDRLVRRAAAGVVPTTAFDKDDPLRLWPPEPPKKDANPGEKSTPPRVGRKVVRGRLSLPTIPNSGARRAVAGALATGAFVTAPYALERLRKLVRGGE